VPIHARIRVALAGLGEGELPEATNSTARLIGRRLPQAEAKRLLGKFGL
jgi:hypothetical protein